MIKDSNGVNYHANPWGTWRVADRRVSDVADTTVFVAWHVVNPGDPGTPLEAWEEGPFTVDGKEYPSPLYGMRYVYADGRVQTWLVSPDYRAGVDGMGNKLTPAAHRAINGVKGGWSAVFAAYPTLTRAERLEMLADRAASRVRSALARVVGSWWSDVQDAGLSANYPRYKVRLPDGSFQSAVTETEYAAIKRAAADAATAWAAQFDADGAL